MRLFQKDAYVSIDFLQRLTELFRISGDAESSNAAINLGQIDKGKHKRNILYEKPIVPEKDAMQSEWKSFFHAIENGKEPIVSAQDGLRALEIALQIRAKINQSKV